MKLFIFLVASFSLTVLTAGCRSQPVHTAAPVTDGQVVISLSSLQQDKPAFYTYHVRGKPVSFFVLKTGDAVESYLDACVKCYPKKLGYRFSEGKVVCKACNVSYPLSHLKDGIGSCYPIVLEGKTDGDTYRISVETVADAERYF